MNSATKLPTDKNAEFRRGHYLRAIDQANAHGVAALIPNAVLMVARYISCGPDWFNEARYCAEDALEASWALQERGML